MDPIERWKLAEELTVYQIALLLAGYNPSEFSIDRYDDWPAETKEDIFACITSVKHAVSTDKLIAKISTYGDYSNEAIDWETTIINIISLCQWLESRNYRDGYFVREEGQTDKVIDPSGEFYAPKLAAAVQAWREVTADPEAAKAKSPKKALEIWLRKHADEYGLTGRDGNPNELGIEVISKVANWRPAGGATPTPVPAVTRVLPSALRSANATWTRKARPNSPTPPQNSPTLRPNSPNGRPTLQLTNIDDDVPF